MQRQFAIGAFVLLLCQQVFAQEFHWRKDTKAFREEITAEYSDSAKSPLTDASLQHFKGHDFFPARRKFCVAATFERTPGDQPFEMPTSSGITKSFVRYGIARFKLNGQDCQLNLYQNLKLAATEEYKDYLFLPFTDLTTGNITYGGGRYIDLRIPERDTIILNFNRAYNPNCAYSSGWNCPIVPRENQLKVEVRAGIRGTAGADAGEGH